MKTEEKSIPGAFSRRRALQRFGMGLGGLALADVLRAETERPVATEFPAKAKRVIYLFMSGGPSQVDLFDPKPLLNQRQGQQLPAEIRGEQRLTGMSANQASIPLAGSPFSFAQHGQSGRWFSELLPHTASVADDLCVIHSMHTDAINHGPGVTFLQTGSQLPGRPSIGSWLDYGLGRENENLPGYVVLITKNKAGQPLMSRLWGSAFLPGKHQGVRFRSGADALLYLANPPGVSEQSRSLALARWRELQEHAEAGTPDEFIRSRLANYEMAFQMQRSVPEASDLSAEPDHVLDMYGKSARDPGSFAANCLIARRLAERGVRFIQLFHQDWDHHGNLPSGLKAEAAETDQACGALIRDLKQRGMLDDTLVVWGGEFGRTNYCQGKFDPANFGRDHHPRCFSMWMAGGGIKPGIQYGRTDEFGYNIVENPVSAHDLHATMLHLLGIDHEKLTFLFQGRRYRLTDVFGKVVKPILA